MILQSTLAYRSHRRQTWKLNSMAMIQRPGQVEQNGQSPLLLKRSSGMSVATSLPVGISIHGLLRPELLTSHSPRGCSLCNEKDDPTVA